LTTSEESAIDGGILSVNCEMLLRYCGWLDTIMSYGYVLLLPALHLKALFLNDCFSKVEYWRNLKITAVI